MTNSRVAPASEGESVDFVRTMVAADTASGKYNGRVVTRFPPEPNGYLHIGHAKSLCLNFGIASEFKGRCHLRFDDTNPTTEDPEYVDAIQVDIRWLGFEWYPHRYYASDYFQKLYDFAVELIRRGKAYVDSSTDEEIRTRRGTIKEPGTPGPYRDRSVEENLELFERMRRGEFGTGEHVLRAKIDLASTNMKMRDPLLYRIRKGAHHYRTGDAWCIYPLYDFAHCLSDAIEHITHSICTLEFENNRELYDWVLDNVGVARPRPEQTEFARLNLSYTVMSKRKLLRLVQEKYVCGWNDPRMPTLSGMRRRGIRPSAIRAFCEEIGVARTHNVIDLARFEHILRDDLNLDVPRVMCVLRPIEVIIDNYPEGVVEELDAPYYPRDVPREGTRAVPFSRRLFIDRDDFDENPPKGWFRLAPGAEVRLRYAYLIRCERVVKDAAGNVCRLHCTYDPASRGGAAPNGRKVKGTIHWVSAEHSVGVEVRLYDRLFATEDPDGAEGDFLTNLNPTSLEVVRGARLEPAAAREAAAAWRYWIEHGEDARTGEPALVSADQEFGRLQFERQGYFALDIDSLGDALVFNRVVTLRDTWGKLQEKAVESSIVPKAESLPTQVSSPLRAVAAKASDETPCGGTCSSGDDRSSDETRAARERLVAGGVPPREAEIIAGLEGLPAFFEAALGVHNNARSVAKWVVNEVRRELKTRSLAAFPFGGDGLGSLVKMVDDGVISATAGKEVLAAMLAGEGEAASIVKARGLAETASEEELHAMVDEVLRTNAEKVSEYRAGKVGLMGFFVGLVMRAAQGKVSAPVVSAWLKEKLDQTKP